MADEGNSITTSLLPGSEEAEQSGGTNSAGLLEQQRQQYAATRNLDQGISVYPPRPNKDRIVLYECPKQRQRWGENQILPHVNWGDLYFDLFYVAAAYNLSYVLLYSMNAQGFLYLLGLMGPILFEWFTRTYFDARFKWGTDPFHVFVEIVRTCFLVTAVVHIRPVYAMSQPSKYPDMFGFSLGMLMLSVCNIYASVEVKLKVVGDEAARRAERENIFSYCVQSVLYLLSAVFAGMSYYSHGSYHDNRETGNPVGLDSLFSTCSLLFAGELQDELVKTPKSEYDETSPTNLPIYLCLGAWVFGVLFWVLKWVLVPQEEHKRQV